MIILYLVFCIMISNQTVFLYDWCQANRKPVPFLFSVFLNDLEDQFNNLAGCPLEIVKEKLEANLQMFIEILVLLYADDTVIFSESKEGMQSALNIFQSYCDKWKLTVNVNRTKVLAFSKRKSKQNFDLTLNGETLCVINSYTYLGITFKYNSSFVDARKKLVEQAQKSLFAIYKKIRNQNIPIDLQLKLFDSW